MTATLPPTGPGSTRSVRLPLGVRLVGAVMRRGKAFSVAHMDEARLARLQQTALPERGPVGLVLGRLPRSVQVETASLPGPQGDLPLRIYRPRGVSGTLPVVVAFHGGGFSLGSARQGDWLHGQVCAGVGAVVVAVDYRLAPTHRFPAAVEDCWAALEWTHEQAVELGADPDRLAVMGDSAGGNLAAVTSLIARDRGGPPVRHQALVYPATDLTEALKEDRSYRENTLAVVLSNEDLEVFHGHYVDDGADPRDWRLSPILAPDHSGLPPALVVLAGRDPLRDSGLRYAEKLAAAGVPVRVEEFHRMPHGFLGIPYLARDARAAAAAVVAAQREALDR
ncbi:alpha/beta hydrolase [Nocardioides solisilvae]|uniref:alpha/beta hydrolase n=1 Tax=Nocardioides solisilvae TaxID=1542435 RepID=UPI000D744DF0|nr:alpha/beta hydrolase [Nocardioides solisilvae]